MKIPAPTFLIIVVATLCAFAGGYWAGTHNTLALLQNKATSDTNLTISNIDKTVAAGSKLNNRRPPNTNIDSAKSTAHNDVVVDGFEAQASSTKSDEQNTFFLPENASVLDTIAFLSGLEIDNQEAYKTFATVLESLSESTKEDLGNFQILLDYFAQSDMDTQIPYYITTLIHSAQVSDKDMLVKDLVRRLSAQGTSSGNTRLLHLVSSNGMQFQNDEILQNIKDIALYSSIDDGNRTYALDLLMPYQLNNSEKIKVVNDLKFTLSQASREEVSYIVENIVRFSEKDERANLANAYLSEANSFETRVAILTTMHNGSVKPSESLKAKLFDIAENTNDPLSSHARDTLMYVFEINNDEYNRLRAGN